MTGVNKIKSKSIGQVRIFEIFGNFSGAFAQKGEEAIRTASRNRVLPCAFFNLSGTKEMDHLGASAIAQNLEYFSKAGVLIEDGRLQEAFRALLPNETQVKVFQDEFEVSDYFSKEFAEGSRLDDGYRDRRQFVRLRTVLPIKFWLDQSNTKEFFAVVTNLSEGGLFAEYIHSRFEDDSLRWLTPAGPNLDICLYLELDKVLRCKGRVVHGEPFEWGVGMEFLGLDDLDKNRIRDWISAHLLRFHKQDPDANRSEKNR